jgi:octaprenyl-diphosphate synthase
VTGDIGKNVGDDLREGKATLPLIRVMQVGDEAERALVREAIERGHTENFAPILAAIKRTGALDYAMTMARAEAAEATAAVHGLPPSVYRDALLYFAAYSIERDR